jgi:hypothetical protein
LTVVTVAGTVVMISAVKRLRHARTPVVMDFVVMIDRLSIVTGHGRGQGRRYLLRHLRVAVEAEVGTAVVGTLAPPRPWLPGLPFLALIVGRHPRVISAGRKAISNVSARC